jgi:YjbE family integral membrane protein
LDFGATLSAAWAAIELATLNLLLGADNAVVVALACRPLPASLRRSALIIGVSSAILLRFGLATLVNALVAAPGVRLAAAAFLLWVAVGIIANQHRARGALKEAETAPPIAATASFWTTVLVVIGADVVVSLDNVVALVSVSQGNVILLVIGLLLSVPALMYGSFIMTKLMDDWPVLIVDA